VNDGMSPPHEEHGESEFGGAFDTGNEGGSSSKVLHFLSPIFEVFTS
jgi:hypothetical protein